MKIVIEGTPDEVADAIRRLAAPQDIKPVFVPHETRRTESLPYIGDFPPPPVDRLDWIDLSKVVGVAPVTTTAQFSPFWQISRAGTVLQ